MARSGPDELLPRARRHTQVVPTATVLARDLEHQLRAIHDALEAFERDLRDGREQDRPDLVATARGHVAAAMDALEQAGRD